MIPRDATGNWIVAAHLLGVVFWMGGLFSIYWLLRIHSHAPKEAHDQLTLMERSLALMTDIAAAVAIGCGIALIVWPINLFSVKPSGWLHLKLTAVVIGVLPVHGMLRARIKKFGQGKISPIPQWLWSVLLVAITTIIIAVVTKLASF
jgi:uncharacterized membrane protein